MLVTNAGQVDSNRRWAVVYSLLFIPYSAALTRHQAMGENAFR